MARKLGSLNKKTLARMEFEKTLKEQLENEYETKMKEFEESFNSSNVSNDISISKDSIAKKNKMNKENEEIKENKEDISITPIIESAVHEENAENESDTVSEEISQEQHFCTHCGTFVKSKDDILCPECCMELVKIINEFLKSYDEPDSKV